MVVLLRKRSILKQPTSKGGCFGTAFKKILLSSSDLPIYILFWVFFFSLTEEKHFCDSGKPVNTLPEHKFHPAMLGTQGEP